jgi:hypothetical protein
MNEIFQDLITVAFLSKALNPVERNYEIHDTEMLAII